MGLGDLLKRAGLADEDPTPPKKPDDDETPATFQARQVGALPPRFPNVAVVPQQTVTFTSHPAAGTDAVSDEHYQRIFNATNFDATEVGATIKKFRDPLEDLPLDESQKFKAALKQAGAQAGVNEVTVMGTFGTLKATLTELKTDFDAKSVSYKEQKITARETRLDAIDAEIAALQQERVTVQTELLDAQSKSSRVQAQFNAAIARRSSELETQQTQYAAMLKG